MKITLFLVVYLKSPKNSFVESTIIGAYKPTKLNGNPANKYPKYLPIVPHRTKKKNFAVGVNLV